MSDAVSVGLVGAGPWARMMGAPVLAAGPETRLAGVWARRPEAAGDLATGYGVPVFAEYGELLDACEAVTFAVPPNVQARMAAEAARAGKALLLDKPLGLTLAQAEQLTTVVEETGVVSMMVLSMRYQPRVREFLRRAAEFRTLGAQARQVTGAFVGGPFTTPWRLEYGALHDIGPHALDLLDAAVGPIEELSATGSPRGWVALTCRHAGGAISQLALTGEVAEGGYTSFELFGTDGALTLDLREPGDDPWPTMRAEFAAAVRSGRPPQLDVHRGLYLQRLLERALAELST